MPRAGSPHSARQLVLEDLFRIECGGAGVRVPGFPLGVLRLASVVLNLTSDSFSYLTFHLIWMGRVGLSGNVPRNQSV